MNLASLHQLHDLGFSIFPLQPKSKKPTASWSQYQSAQVDRDQLEEWISTMPRMNVAIATGRISDLTVIDIDSEEARLWCIEQGGFPKCPIVRTGKGWQLYFSYHPKLGNKASVGGQKLDVRGDGGYVVAPPSIHPDGPEYEWVVSALDCPMPLIPEWFITLVESPEPAPKPTMKPVSAGEVEVHGNYGKKILDDELQNLSMAQEGSRNQTLNNVTFSIFTAVYGDIIDLSESEVKALIEQTALQIGLGQAEINKTMSSAMGAAKQNPRPKPKSTLRPVKTHGKGNPDKGNVALKQDDKIDFEKRNQADEMEAFTYFINETGQMCYKGSKSTFPICDFTAYITEQIEDEDGAREYKIEVTNSVGEITEEYISVEDFSNNRTLRSVLETMAGAGHPIYERRLPHMNPAIHILSKQDVEIKRFRRFRRTGWIDGDLFLMPPGFTSENMLVKLPNRKLPYRIAEHSFEEAKKKEILKMLIDSMGPENTLPIITYLMGAPAAKFLGWREMRYALFVKGITGNLKTTFTQTAMALYGEDFTKDTSLLKWGEGATANAMMSMATSIWDLPMLIDNYKPNTGGGQRALVAFIHAVMEGGEKHRLNRSSEMKDSKEIFTWPICTGEDVPDNDTAAVARMLVVEFNNTKKGWNKKLGTAGEHGDVLNAIGTDWISWLASQDHEFWRSQRIRTKEVIQHYQETISEYFPEMKNANRVSQNIAVNTVTFELMCTNPQYGELFMQYREAYNNAVQTVLTTMDETTKESLEAHRFIMALQELVTSGKALLLDLNEPQSNIDNQRQFEKDKQQQKMIGWHDERFVYLLPSVSRQTVEKMLGKDGLNQISQRQLYAQLNSVGAIAKSDDDRVGTTRIRVNGNTVRVIKIPLEQFEDKAEPVTGTAVTEKEEESPF